MIKVTDAVLEQIKENMERGSWIPWNEFLKLKVNDTIKIPSYNHNDELIGYEIVKINKIEIQHPNWEDWGGATIGHISGWYTKEYLDKEKFSDEGGMSGVLSVKTDEISNFPQITAKNIYNDNLKVYNSFDEAIGKWIKENKIEHSELNFETMKQVIEDIGESWYRQSLGKTLYH